MNDLDHWLEHICGELGNIHSCLGADSPLVLSFRDRCAIAAMQGFAANPQSQCVTLAEAAYAADVARLAFIYADAMVEHRKARGK